MIGFGSLADLCGGGRREGRSRLCRRLGRVWTRLEACRPPIPLPDGLHQRIQALVDRLSVEEILAAHGWASAVRCRSPVPVPFVVTSVDPNPSFTGHSRCAHNREPSAGRRHRTWMAAGVSVASVPDTCVKCSGEGKQPIRVSPEVWALVTWVSFRAPGSGRRPGSVGVGAGNWQELRGIESQPPGGWARPTVTSPGRCSQSRWMRLKLSCDSMPVSRVLPTGYP